MAHIGLRVLGLGALLAVPVVVGVMAAGAGGARAAEDGRTAHDFSFPSIDGGTVDLADFAGKAVLVVNTASQCGFTGQYEGLQALWEAWRDRGLVVLGVPSNDFGGQEPGSEAEIADFCATTFSVDFPMTGKESVRGDGAHPFYRWARDELGVVAAPKWNFHKYLVGPDGRLVDWFSTVTPPDSAAVRRAVERALAGAS